MANLTRQLTRLSDASGGRTVIAPDASQLSDAFRDVVDELSHQYVLSYAPTNDKRVGTWRALAVEVPGRHRRPRDRDPDPDLKADRGRVGAEECDERQGRSRHMGRRQSPQGADRRRRQRRALGGRPLGTGLAPR